MQESPATEKDEVKQPTAKKLNIDAQRIADVRKQAKCKASGFGYAVASVFAGLLISGAAAMLSTRRS